MSTVHEGLHFTSRLLGTAQAVLLRAVFLGMKHAVRVMKQQRSSVILNTASVAGVNGGLEPKLYATSKAGITHLIKNGTAELAPWRIRVVGIAPGKIATPYAVRFAGLEPGDEKAIAEAFKNKSLLPGRHGDDVAQGDPAGRGRGPCVPWRPR